MAPPPSDQPDAAAGTGAISKVLIVIAMQTEAMPLVNKFKLVDAPPHESMLVLPSLSALLLVGCSRRFRLPAQIHHHRFPKGAPWVRYHGNYKGLHIDLVWPGKDTALGVDSVGTVSAALVTYASIQTLKPDLIINAGTAGGFKAKGANIGDVFLASDVAFHDRRIPIPVFDMYGIGARKALETPNILKALNLKVGKLSTGDSLDMTPHDETAILNNEATVKDMEGAAVAYVADMFSTPAIFVKAVTDIVDGEKPTAEEFLQNLVAVTAALDQAVTEVMESSASPSKQLLELDACTTFKLEAGIKPTLPDPCTTFKLEAGGIKAKLLPDEPCSSQLKLEVGSIQPKLLDACSQLKPDPCSKPKKLPDASTVKVKVEAGTEEALLEPKPEPLEEDALPPNDWEISPVSGGHPFFTTVFSRSQVQKPFQLVRSIILYAGLLAIPTRFHRHLPEARVPAVLLCRGQSWPTSYCGDLKVKKLDAAWRGFAVDNQLRIGDAGVFELVDADPETEGEARSSDKKTVLFRVQVLRGDLPEELTSKGATSDEPLVIVDS
ncbi:hypothetical protein EJB05_46712 [Eragrostis curvula]|uniref:TF-B3 domain-containing protein n=1 Tax=Eragrostis curvula TaxID=38414 RepID=A0A5J9TQ91_9POAL|nr:hypothetical protein EJB05_46712 [Eragrostis curvula]